MNPLIFLGHLAGQGCGDCVPHTGTKIGFRPVFIGHEPDIFVFVDKIDDTGRLAIPPTYWGNTDAEQFCG